jgi:hypothetical protein
MFWSIRLALLSLVIVLAVALAPGHAQSPAPALLQQSANAMGGLTALRALKTQVIESEGKQFDSSSTPQPLGPTRQITTFRYTLTRDLTQPRLRLQWEAQSLASNQTVRFVEIIDGSTGMLQEGGDGGKQVRLHPGRLVAPARGAAQSGKANFGRLEPEEFTAPRRRRAGRQTLRGVVV